MAISRLWAAIISSCWVRCIRTARASITATSTLAPVGNVFDWDGSYPRPRLSEKATNEWTSDATQYALYGTVQFRASDALAILAGMRINWREGKETSAGAPTFEYK